VLPVDPCRIAETVDVIFVEPLYAQNIGFIARSMKNFCLGRLIIVNPRCELGVEAVKYSMHGVDKLNSALILNNFSEAVKRYDYVVCTTGKRGRSSVRRSMTPEEAAERLVEFNVKKALVIGREDIGLKNSELERCDAVATIPANPEYPILNASHAAAIFFYLIYRRAGNVERVVDRPSREEVERFFYYLDETAKLLNVSEERRRRMIVAFKRLLAESKAPRSDLSLVFGLVRKSYEKLATMRKTIINADS